MWPFRTPTAARRARSIARLRRAQERGEACVVCGKTSPRPTVPMFANSISGWGCPSHKNVFALTPGSTR